MRRFKNLYLIFLLCLALAVPALAALAADPAKDLNIDVKKFKLKNGMLFLVVERHTTPQVACNLAIRAGAALDQAGKTGIAHMLEHMLFKGTKNFGTLDHVQDQELQEKIEAAYQAVLEEQDKRTPNQETINARLAEMRKWRQEVQSLFIPQALSTQMGRNGAVNINAHTDHDQTWYTMSVPSDMMEQWFSMVSEQIFEPAFREFYVEKEVVQREREFRYEGNPAAMAQLDLYTLAFTAHPYRNPVIGWQADIARFSTWDAIAFYKKYYNPNNAVCVLVGDVTLEKAKELAEIYFGRYIKGDFAPERVTAEPKQEGPRRSIRLLKGARQPLVRIGFHTPALGTKEFYALDLLQMLLSYGRSARLNQELLNKGLAQEAWAYNPDARYAGLFMLGGSPREPIELQKPDLTPEQKYAIYLKACEELEGLLLKETERLKTESVSERELQRIKKLNYRDILEQARSNETLAEMLATQEVEIGWRYLLDYLQKIDEITPADLQQAAVRYLDPDQKNTVYIIPGGEPDKPIEPYEEIRTLKSSAAPKAALPELPQVNFSVYPTPEAWKHPLSFKRKPKKIQYPQADILEIGKTTVFYLPDNELPMIQLNLLVKAGAVDLPENQAGLADLFESCLVRGGTRSHSPQEWAALLDENAIRISVEVHEEQTSISLSVLKEDWEKGLAFLTELLAQPGFDPLVLISSKDQILTELKRQGGNAEAVVGREAMLWHFKGHPYGRDPLLALQILPSLTGRDLQQFLQTYFAPGNMVISVAGDIGRKTLMTDLQKFVQFLPGQVGPSRKLADPPETPPVLALIPKPGQVEAQIYFLLPGLKRTQADYWKMDLLMDVLGGEDALLSQKLREELGLVYTSGFVQTYKWQAGLLVGFASNRSDLCGDVIQETVKILNQLRGEVSAEELEQKRLDQLNSFVFNVDTPAALVNAYSRYYLRGEELDTLDKIQETYLTANKKDLENLAKKWLDPHKLQIFIVADKNTPVKKADSPETTLEQELKNLAEKLGLPYQEIPLR
jgi:predicted Zn-dependent peptidase